MNLLFLFEMPGSFEWLVIIFSILFFVALLTGVVTLVYFIVKKATKSAFKDEARAKVHT